MHDVGVFTCLRISLVFARSVTQVRAWRGGKAQEGCEVRGRDGYLNLDQYETYFDGKIGNRKQVRVSAVLHRGKNTQMVKRKQIENKTKTNHD